MQTATRERGAQVRPDDRVIRDDGPDVTFFDSEFAPVCPLTARPDHLAAEGRDRETIVGARIGFAPDLHQGASVVPHPARDAGVAPAVGRSDGWQSRPSALPAGQAFKRGRVLFFHACQVDQEGVFLSHFLVSAV
ncbi:MAG: hypothetical protein KJO70_02625, partial [Gammaproteobacteria bacterium]|nr:hypothetical protein [Gammaproteobacteria bacterium]